MSIAGFNGKVLCGLWVVHFVRFFLSCPAFCPIPFSSHTLYLCACKVCCTFHVGYFRFFVHSLDRKESVSGCDWFRSLALSEGCGRNLRRPRLSIKTSSSLHRVLFYKRGLIPLLSPSPLQPPTYLQFTCRTVFAVHRLDSGKLASLSTSAPTRTEITHPPFPQRL